MIIEYIEAALAQAKYEIIEDEGPSRSKTL